MIATSNASKKLLYMGNPDEEKGKLQKVWFSTNGLLAFAWFSLPNGLHHIRLWGVSSNSFGCIEHQIVSPYSFKIHSLLS
jgi:hypothetical protein